MGTNGSYKFDDDNFLFDARHVVLKVSSKIFALSVPCITQVLSIMVLALSSSSSSSSTTTSPALFHVLCLAPLLILFLDGIFFLKTALAQEHQPDEPQDEAYLQTIVEPEKIEERRTELHKTGFAACSETADEEIFFQYVKHYYETSYWGSFQSMMFHKIRGAHEMMCPAAVLQTMLLKLEVSMFGNDEVERDEQKSLYLRYMHENLGRINPAWPLAEGWRRVVNLQEELERKTSYSISMIMNMCSVKDLQRVV